MATWLTHSTDSGSQDSAIQVSIREDLLDFVTNIDPVETPLFSMSQRTQATSTKHEWLTDSLAAVSTAGALEGAAFSGANLTEAVRVANYTQIIKKDFDISGTNQAVDHAGIPTQSSYQAMKAMGELARNTEASLLQGVQNGTPQGSSTLARTMDGLTTLAGNSVTAVSTTVDEVTKLNALLELIWLDGATADTMLVDSVGKKAISGYTTTTRIHHQGGPTNPNAISRNVQVYESDFGTVDIFLERHCAAADRGYAFQREYVRTAVLRPTFFEELGKVGDSVRFSLLHELTLEVTAADAVGKMVIA
jgi:hypothetical protein